MEHFDAVVIGAGPAGALAAHDLARGSARVLLVERGELERAKPCGGGVVAGATRELPFSITPVVERRVHGFRLRLPRGRSIEHVSPRPLASMTRRSRLDPFLVARASDAGTRVDAHRPVRSVEPSGRGFCVRFAGQDAVSAAVVIGADGAESVVRRSLGGSSLPRIAALEIDVDGVPPGLEREVFVELGTVQGGFGWIFPKIDHCNVGVGGYPTSGRDLHVRLEAMLRRERPGMPVRARARGYLIPVSDDSPVCIGAAALVGDAAGLADPLSGEGIGPALRSGRIAAGEALALLAGEREGFEGYAARIESEIRVPQRIASRIHRVLHGHPRLAFGLLPRLPLAHLAICALLEGDLPYPEIARRLGPVGRLLTRNPRSTRKPTREVRHA